MATTAIPIPQGATIGDSVPSGVPIPQGATIGDPINSGQSNSGQAPERGVIANLVGGAEKGASQFVTGAANLAASGMEHLTGAPAGSLHATAGPETEQPSIARDIGEGAENVGEFMAGETGLEGLAKAARITELAQKSRIIARTLELAKEHPVLAKMIGEGTKGAVVGGAQGAVKGAAEGNAKGEAEAGAVGGGAGGSLATGALEAVTPLAKEVAAKFGVGTSAITDAVRGARPGKRNYKFAEDFLRAAPYMDAENTVAPAKTVEDWADHIENARNKLYQTKIDPLVQANATQPLGGLNIANGIRNQIPAAMKQFSPEEAAKMEELANKFMPQSQFHLQMQDAEQALQHYNAELAATGFWSKMPSERAALLKTNGEIAGLKAAGDAIRDEFYGRLNQLAPNSDIASLKRDYGALRNVEDEVRGRVNVSNRQSPLSMKETIGLITGHPVGVAIPMVDRIVNSPENLIGRAVNKATGKEGAISKGAQAAGTAVKEHGGETAANLTSQAGRLVFQSSDGAVHSIPNNPNALAHAKHIDPSLKVLSE